MPHPTNHPLGQRARGAWFGLGAAALFGMSAPMAKVLLGSTPPVLLAGLLYLGAAAGLWLLAMTRPASSEAPLGRSDLPRLLGVVLAGGVVAPVLMLFGLSRVTTLMTQEQMQLECPIILELPLNKWRTLPSRPWLQACEAA